MMYSEPDSVFGGDNTGGNEEYELWWAVDTGRTEEYEVFGTGDTDGTNYHQYILLGYSIDTQYLG